MEVLIVTAIKVSTQNNSELIVKLCLCLNLTKDL